MKINIGNKSLLRKRQTGFCFLNFAVTMSPFCGATGTLYFRPWLTSPMGFKAMVDVPSPALNVAFT